MPTFDGHYPADCSFPQRALTFGINGRAGSFLFYVHFELGNFNPKQNIRSSIHPISSNLKMSALILPEPFAGIPKADLLFGPSPIHHLPRISEALGGKVSIWAKREDCNSGIAFGGNKTRKLEYYLSPHFPL